MNLKLKSVMAAALLSGMVLVGAWVMLDLPLGPGASVFAPVPAAP